MILSSGTKKPKIHSSAYVAPTATIAGDVTIGGRLRRLHGAVITAEGAPVTIGAKCVVMEHAVSKAAAAARCSFRLAIGDRCIVGPHAYVVGATIGSGCFIAGGAKIFNGAVLGDGAGAALGAIVHVNAHVSAGESVPMLHIAYGDPAQIVPPQRAPEVHAAIDFYAGVFNLEAGPTTSARGRPRPTPKFLRKTHAQDAALEEHRNVKPPPRRRAGEEPPPTQATQVDKVVDVMMLELEEMEHRRQEAIRRQKGR